MSFVIMLNHELAAHQNDWPITAEADTLAAIRNVTQFAGTPLLTPHSGRAMTRIEDKALTDTQTGTIRPGGIYSSH